MSEKPWRFRGALAELDGNGRAFLCRRDSARDLSVRERTSQIISRVRQGGDGAVRELALELDGVRLETLEVPRRLWRTALSELPPGLRGALERAAANIARAHRAPQENIDRQVGRLADVDYLPLVVAEEIDARLRRHRFHPLEK